MKNGLNILIKDYRKHLLNILTMMKTINRLPMLRKKFNKIYLRRQGNKDKLLSQRLQSHMLSNKQRLKFKQGFHS